MADRTGLHRHSRAALAAAGLCLAAAVLGVPAPARSQDPAPQPTDSPYIGAAACKACHAAVHESWAKSKHASSFRALTSGDAANDTCVGCHATGVADDLRAADGTPHLPGTQCEACHGPGRAHAAAASDRAAKLKSITVKPQAEVCERCHNRQGPRFQGFVYAPMVRLVHVHPGR